MDVLNAQSADDWETVVSGCFVPLRCAGFETNFTGKMEHISLDDRISVSLVTTSGTSAERTERLAQDAASDDIHISLQRSSRGVVSGNGRSAAVNPGSVSIYATDRHYYLDYSPPEQQQLIVQVSRASLGLPAEMLEDAMWRLSVPGGWKSTQVRNLFSYVSIPEAGAAKAAAGERDAATLRDLTSTMIRSSFGEGSGTPRTPGALRHVVQQYLRNNATKPGIDMELVAREHFVSRRRLYQVFEEIGQSPAAFLLGERLKVAQRLLVTATESTIEWVAYESGFGDVTTFARAFKRVHGCTPREWRAAGGELGDQGSPLAA